MKKGSRKREEDLLPEYDFSKLTLVRKGPGRTQKGRKKVLTRVTLNPEVASVFNSEAAVNHALQFLIHLARKETRSHR
jgi:hypothetical protein